MTASLPPLPKPGEKVVVEPSVLNVIGRSKGKIDTEFMRRTAHEIVDFFAEFQVAVEVVPGHEKGTGNPAITIEAVKPKNEVEQ